MPPPPQLASNCGSEHNWQLQDSVIRDHSGLTPAHRIVLEDCIIAVEAATARRERPEAQIETILPDWSLAPVVRALQALRGLALVAAATLVAELGDVTRFDNPRRFMAYLGLFPSEHSNGSTRPQSGIAKVGNGAARRVLIEAAWSYRSRRGSAENSCCVTAIGNAEEEVRRSPAQALGQIGPAAPEMVAAIVAADAWWPN